MKDVIQPTNEKRYKTLSQLHREGLSMRYLKEIVKIPRQDFAWKLSPEKKNSPYIVDMIRFESFKDRQIKLSR